MLRRILTLIAVALCASSAKASAMSCEDCKATIRSALLEWSVIAPGLIADLPGTLCSQCPVRSSCEALVVSGIEAFSEEVNHTNASWMCDHLGLCNGTVMISDTIVE
jgi:hypothetical protein